MIGLVKAIAPPLFNQHGYQIIDVAERLHTLLAQLKLKTPYILVGHSLGGLYMQMYAFKYPKEVRNMLLIDTTLYNILNWPSFNPYKPNFSPAVPYYGEALEITPNLKYMKKIFASCRKRCQLYKTKIILLTATHHKILNFTPKMERDWKIWHSEFANQSNTFTNIIINSGHFIQNEYPDIVIAEIKKLVKS